MTRNGRPLLAIAFLLVAAIAPADDALFRILVDGRWGFMNADGEVVIEPQFDHAYRFRNGHTVVRRGDYEGGKRALMDADGNLITGYNYDRAYHFVGGFAMGVINGRWGFIRPDGSTLGSFRYDAVIPFADGHAGVRVGDGSDSFWGIIDANGREVLPPAYPRLRYAGEGLWWVGMAWSEWALYRPGDAAPADFPYLTTGTFEDGHAIVRRALADTEVYQVLAPDLSERFQSQRAIRAIGEGWFLVSGEGGLRYVSLDGDPLNDEVYYSGTPFTDGVARVSVGTSWSNQKWGILAADGSYLMPPRYDSLAAFDANGIARYRIGDLFGFVDRSGDEVTPPLWENTGAFGDGLVPVLRDGLWGYMDTSGELAIPLQYDYAWDFVDGYAVARYGDVDTGQRIYIDPTGAQLTDERFEWAYVFNDGLAHIAEGDFRDGSFGYMDRDGEIIWEPTR